MNGLRNAQALYDRRLPGDREPRAEREFCRGDAEAPAGAHVIRSSKVIQISMPKHSADGENKTSD